jgi:hypothetical protein
VPEGEKILQIKWDGNTIVEITIAMQNMHCQKHKTPPPFCTKIVPMKMGVLF